MKSLFITGTDTGVGKTVLTAALLTTLRAQGLDAVPMKPIQTGCRITKSGLSAPDLDFCLEMAELRPSPEELEWMAPYRFEPACSPHLAAAQAGVIISVDRILECQRNLLRRHELVLMEGAGGILVPINEREFMLDIMVRAGLPVILAARAGLGTLNHTLLSLRSLREAKLEVLAVVLVDSEPADWGTIEQDNVVTLEKMGRVPVVTRLSYLEGLQGSRLPRKKFREVSAISLQPILERLGVAT